MISGELFPSEGMGSDFFCSFFFYSVFNFNSIYLANYHVDLMHFSDFCREWG